MRHVIIVIGVISSLLLEAQTIEEIDQLRTETLQKLDQYECIEYIAKKILNEDAVQYDTARFYINSDNKLIHMKWKSRSHAFHIVGDGIGFTELFFIDDQAVFKRNYGYSFKNGQWHLEPNLDETKVSVTESLREYYRLDGSALMDYIGRSAEGIYKNRFTLLDTIPLEAKLERRWSDRCDECIEEDYLSIYRELLKEKGE